MTQNREPVSLLWTGGWDSTYRLLDLLLVKKREVQPYYVIDSERLSTRLEINRMKQIKRRLFKKNPNTISLLKATVFTEMFDIEQNSAITQSFNRLSEKYHFGSQCEWLARFCSQYGIASMELSFERGVAVTAYQDALTQV
jgi:hypothetical protein